MAKRLTKQKTLIRLPEEKISRIENMVDAWSYDTKAFIRSRLKQYSPVYPVVSRLRKLFGFALPVDGKSRHMSVLNNPEILNDWKKRFEYSGETNEARSWNRIIEKELTDQEYRYLIAVLDRELTDLHVPGELETFFKKIYRAFIRKEYQTDKDLPKAPILLVEGASGSGKSATVKEAVEEVIFRNEVVPTIDWKMKKKEILADKSLFTNLEDVDPEFAVELARRKKRAFYRRLSTIPLIKLIFKKRIMKNLTEFEEQGILVDYSTITPNDYKGSRETISGGSWGMPEPPPSGMWKRPTAHSAGRVQKNPPVPKTSSGPWWIHPTSFWTRLSTAQGTAFSLPPVTRLIGSIQPFTDGLLKRE
jgi:hypothetical protein